ncbi:MAG: carboxypeptidase-like regulatory domain-containing protein, partial [Bacteroidales bacterium]|nr:carboxypeptidase-like regulatory domain-containing protein [Bacteroidales bacterium]
MKRILLLVPAIFMYALLGAQQARTLTGKVMDETGQPLAGAGVMLPDGMRGTVTDADGVYSIGIGESDELLSFSFLGYETMNVNVKGKSSVDVILMPDNANTLNDVVVIGYGSAKKQDLTGSVSVVKMNAIEDLPVTSVDQALQGRIAGVDIVSSGAPGGASSINIRGARSITASNEPLIVVDGCLLYTSDGADEARSVDLGGSRIIKK